MAIADRLKEERQRLNLSQTAFAALAGVTKSAQIKWERGSSSAPTAPALAAFAEAGADVLYILTGRRTNDRPENAATQIEDQLSEIRRDMLEPARRLLPGEDAEQAERRVLERQAGALDAILRYDAAFLTPELREEVESLRGIIADPVQLAAFRAADHAQMRAKRREMKERLAGWFGHPTPYDPGPGEPVLSLLATIAMDYDVPIKLLIELVEEIHDDIAAKAKTKR